MSARYCVQHRGNPAEAGLPILGLVPGQRVAGELGLLTPPALGTAPVLMPDDPEPLLLLSAAIVC